MNGRRISLSITLVALAIGAVFFYQSAAFNTRAGDEAPLYSADRHDASGTAALEDLLVERGNKVRDLERPRLEPDDQGVLIEVLPVNAKILSHDDPLHLQTGEIADWIARGNTVVQFTRSATKLMDHFNIKAGNAPWSPGAAKVEQNEASSAASPATAYLADYSLPQANGSAGNRLLLYDPLTFAAKQPAEWSPLAWLQTKDKQVVAGQFRIGKGKLIVVGAPTPLLNDTLNQEGNLEFILELIGNQPVIMDEWSHGVGRKATIVGFLHDIGLLPVLLQIAFVLGLYVWSTSGYRRGAEPAAPRQRSSIEQIQTLGYLYSRSLSRSVAFDRINAEVQRRLCEALRCQPRDLSARTKALKPETRSGIERLFEQMDGLRSTLGPRCLDCGYDLSMNRTGRCPECGTVIPPQLRQRVAGALPVKAAAQRRSAPSNAAFAQVLTLSHQLSREIQRDRRIR